MSQALGTHIILDLYGCNPDVMLHVPTVQSIMRSAAEEAQFTIVTEEYHQFEPHGVSGCTIISESHLTFHGWAEHKYASIDVFYCGENPRAQKCIDHLIKAFGATHYEIETIARGLKNTYERF